MENFLIHPISERDIDVVIGRAGGDRAHKDANRRKAKGADYVLGDALIELKTLDNEGLLEDKRQRKLAELFSEDEQERPVIVIDRAKLSQEKQRAYDHIMQGPVKGAVASARKQLRQSRKEFQDTKASILFVINNGYSAMNHESLRDIVVRRARNDSEEIDGVVVAGCYFHSDTFDSYFLWPMDYLPINVGRPFESYEILREAWNDYAENFMTAVVIGDGDRIGTKGPVADVQFDVDGVTYVKPSPRLGKASGFFGGARPRRDTTGLTHCPPVAVTFADLTEEQWQLLRDARARGCEMYDSYSRWRRERARAVASGTAQEPFVAVPITFADWDCWRQSDGKQTDRSIGTFANELFNKRVRAIMNSTREYSESGILPSYYILAVTEVIGQDKANDVSHIAVVRERAGGEPIVRVLADNQRIFHEHAVALAAAYAIAEGIECVRWRLDKRYAWI